MKTVEEDEERLTNPFNRFKHLLVGSTFLALGLLILYFNIVKDHKEKQLMVNGQTVDGIVVKEESRNHRHGKRYDYLIDYVTLEGNKFSIRSNHHKTPVYTIGDTVAVRYLEQHPEVSIITVTSSVSSQLFYFLFWFFPLTIGITSLVRVFWWNFHERK